MAFTETMPDQLPRYFFGAKILEVADFIIGFSDFPVDVNSAVRTTVECLARDQPRLDIPDPAEMFDTFLTVGLVSWEERCRIARTCAYHNWNGAMGAYVRIDYTPNFPHGCFDNPPLQDYSLRRPVQLDLITS